MTIKRRLFFSNIRMILILIGCLPVIVIINRFIMGGIFRAGGFADIETSRRMAWHLQSVSLVGFAVFFIIINYIFTNRVIKKITSPLEILNQGVKQIHKMDYTHRLEYTEDDEFYQVCETFNLMAEQLEAAAARREKDEKNRRELLIGISHDLRTPLTTISGYLEGLESGVACTPKMQETYFNTIKKNTARMKHIIEQLFLFSKLDMNEFSIFPQRFDIKRAVSHMIEELEEEYKMKGIKIKVMEGGENIFVNTDLEYFRRVVINILENSANYKKNETGCLEVSVSRDENFAKIKFADDGPGVDPASLPKLFDVFYRCDPSRHTSDHRSAGSGLGLPISSKIIELSGGTIHAENGNTGGLIVTISLPIVTEAA